MKSDHIIVKKFERRVSFIGAKFLELMEKNFPDITENGQWHEVRTKTFDIVNNVIRANRADMTDLYHLPIHRKRDGKIHLSLSAMKIIDSLEFSKKPRVIYISMTADNKDLLEDFSSVLGYGNVLINKDIVTLHFSGQAVDEFTKVLKCLPMSRNTLDRFNDWCEDK